MEAGNHTECDLLIHASMDVRSSSKKSLSESNIDLGWLLDYSHDCRELIQSADDAFPPERQLPGAFRNPTRIGGPIPGTTASEPATTRR